MSNVKFQQFEVEGYATQANARKAMEKKLANYNEVQTIRWMMTVNAQGRFVPVVYSCPGWMIGSLVHRGICVVG